MLRGHDCKPRNMLRMSVQYLRPPISHQYFSNLSVPVWRTLRYKKPTKSVTMFLLASLVALNTLFPLIASECVCNLTVDQRQIRKNICLENLNSKLYQHIQSVNQILSYLLNLSFDLDEVLKNTTSANEFSVDYHVLDFIAMGGLEIVNWTKVVNYNIINNTDTNTYMESNFALPVMDDLRKLVLSYGFPYGIFRQTEPLRSYVGLNTTNNSSLCYCIAGGELTLTFSTNASIDLRINSNSFADFSRTIEDQINDFMATYDPFRETFIYCRVANVERPTAAPAQVYLGLVFTEVEEPRVAHHLDNITLALPEVIWVQHLAKSSFVILYNGTTTATATSSTTAMPTTEDVMDITLLDPRKRRVSFAYVWKNFDSDGLTSRELRTFLISIGGFLGVFLGLVFLLLGLQLRTCSTRKPEKMTSNST